MQTDYSEEVKTGDFDMATAKAITDYEVMFAMRTGLTIMIPKQHEFDIGAEQVRFSLSPENPQDILIRAAEKAMLLKNLKRSFIDAAVERGFIMFYELDGEEVVRCTPCQLGK